MFLLYLILPQTQGAKFLYEEYVHPYLEKNETQIDDFIVYVRCKVGFNP